MSPTPEPRPQSPWRIVSPDVIADQSRCGAMIRTGSRSFHAASLLLPRRVREPAHVIYAFCRLADDAVDEEAEGRSAQLDAVARLRGRLDRAYAGQPDDNPVDRALARVIRDHDMPRALPEALLEGLEWDAQGRRYADLGQLTAYAARVAGAVGAMIAVLMGARGEAELARACDLGVAMQFTNIARDVGTDARAGRVYLPTDWLVEAGLTPERLIAAPEPCPAIRALVARLLAEAERLYVRSEAGIARLPGDCAPAILAARRIYAEIGARIAAADHDSVTARAVVSGRRKLGLALGAVTAAPVLRWRGRACADPALAETQFLVAAAARADRIGPGGVAWAIELFTQLAARDQMRGATRA